ncbi:unnamed protein product [Caenorhabditis auriculariae]|uniref:Uncharacterized protein n=1 Tax=Caenorhabditis auriculariae TaxID=2777116 RepID=A0A8S1H0R9_9PELO|nr:unnamed protein product [Caenorhabditis auriculariae]
MLLKIFLLNFFLLSVFSAYFDVKREGIVYHFNMPGDGSCKVYQWCASWLKCDSEEKSGFSYSCVAPLKVVPEKPWRYYTPLEGESCSMFPLCNNHLQCDEKDGSNDTFKCAEPTRIAISILG